MDIWALSGYSGFPQSKNYDFWVYWSLYTDIRCDIQNLVVTNRKADRLEAEQESQTDNMKEETDRAMFGKSPEADDTSWTDGMVDTVNNTSVEQRERVEGIVFDWIVLMCEVVSTVAFQ